MLRAAACFLLVAAAARAETVIGGVDRPHFLEGEYPGASSLPLSIQFAKDRGLPAEVTGFNVSDAVRIHARAGGAWEAIEMSGWTRSSLTVWVPTRLLAKRGVLTLRVTVNKVETNAFPVRILPPPAQVPVILSVSPERVPVDEKGEENALLVIHVRDCDEWGYAGVRAGKEGCFLGRVDLRGDGTGVLQAWFPKEARTRIAKFALTVLNRVGASEAVELLVGKEPPTLRSVERPPIRREDMAPEAEARPPARADALWIHGNAFLVESEQRIARIARRGDYGRIEFTAGKPGEKGHDLRWFHFSLPTPGGTKVRAVALRFRCDRGIGVAHVHLWDGDRRLFAEDRGWDQRLTGPQTPLLRLPAPASAALGLTISVGVMVPRGLAAESWIEFVAAGVEVE